MHRTCCSRLAPHNDAKSQPAKCINQKLYARFNTPAAARSPPPHVGQRAGGSSVTLLLRSATAPASGNKAKTMNMAATPHPCISEFLSNSTSIQPRTNPAPMVANKMPAMCLSAFMGCYCETRGRRPTQTAPQPPERVARRHEQSSFAIRYSTFVLGRSPGRGRTARESMRLKLSRC